ncbi:muellerian-inhibiting factor-like [Synchiropus splendidus]|uniref:muellerian-inhibiting factor-like n=1 Tax=Synchiropus splendidus TaxID=270530 RepID=UPI00237ECB03|nr:muellerian-inhibiting factor-like [Synchiropus splendidus]
MASYGRSVTIRWTILVLTLAATILARDLMTPLTDRGPEPVVSSTEASPASQLKGLCFENDVIALMQEAVAENGELTNHGLASLGVCSPPQSETIRAVLQELAQLTGTNLGPQLLHPSEVLLVEDEQGEALTLTFHLSQSPLLKRRPVLLLVLESPVQLTEVERVTFSSASLQPAAQTVCISEETRLLLLLGQASQVPGPNKWSISVQNQAQETRNKVNELFLGGRSSSDLKVAPLLLFTGGPGSETSPSQTPTFLCTLRRFLSDSQPQDHPASPALKLDSLQTLPPHTLGLSSSESLLAQLINSSAPTAFTFSSLGFPVQQAELNLPPLLLDELRARLEQIVGVTQSQFKKKEESHRGIKRLTQLVELTTIPLMGPVSGGRQFCAFLLLKALQTVSREMNRAQRVTRAVTNRGANANLCGLKSLTVCLSQHVVAPNSANINNCKGSCLFPMTNTRNHAVLLFSHIIGPAAQERRPCCVPVAYDPLEVVDLNKYGTNVIVFPDMVATECECR